MNINTTAYDKHAAFDPGHGYEARAAAPISIIVHSTSNPNQKNTAFASEAKFLYTSALVSAHFLVGKNGAIVQFLDPLEWAAWHSGPAQSLYLNQRSIGIELHHSVGDAPYPLKQKDALAELLRMLMARFAIAVDHIDTHGQVAIKGPYDRKKDPHDWPHTDFIAWRNALTAARPYHVKGLPVYQRADHSGPLWGHLLDGAVVVIDDTSNGHLADGRGFVDLAGLEAL